MTAPLTFPQSTDESSIAHHRQIFRLELEDAIESHQSPQQLTAAINAHAAFLRWDKDQSKINWRRFIKLWKKVEL